ncbi:hypothetical protein [Bombella apis]|uniref:hypothetical protein n=1 Tax=Bombella apis TaxID=1785988 RepID=UPI0012B73BEA|nr:hypothetical protein [Bombella apis]MPV99805.1 hypothetical protein [Bombella apis]
MKQSDITQLFAVPWASQADSSTVANIPVTATVIERASMAKGFPKATMTPLAAGGVPPYGEDMNGILAMLSQAARAAEVGLVRPFSQAYSDAIGGYPAGAVVLHPSISGRCVMNTWDNNTSPPPGNGWLDPLAGFVTGGPYIPSSLRSGHNDSQVNNAFYDNDNGGNLVVSVVGKGLVYIQPADDYALNSSLSGAVSALTAAISAERNRAMAVEGGLIPTQPRSGHNDSQVNNAFYDNDNGGNLVVSVVGKGLVYIQPADDYALNSSLSGAVSALTAAISAERNRAMAVEGGLIPTQPRSGHNDSQVNNAFYDNDNGGNLVVSVVGKGLVYIQPADDYALNSSLSGAVSALTAAISAERNRAMAVEGGLIPTQPRSGHNDSQVNNAFYDNDNGGNLVVSVVGKGLVYIQPADDYALNSSLSGAVSALTAAISAERNRAMAVEGGLIPTQPRSGHNDSQVNNAFYDNDNGGNLVVSVVGKGLVYIQPADDYALNSSLSGAVSALTAAISAERNRAMAVEGGLIPTQPRSGHNDSQVNNAFYDNDNGGNLVVSVVGKGLVYIQPADDYALNSSLSGAVSALTAAISAERNRAMAVEGGLIPTQPRSGHNDSQVNNAFYDNDNGGNLVVSVVGKGLVYMQPADNYACVRGTSKKTATQNFFVKPYGNVFGVTFPEPFAATDPKTEIIIQATPARVQGGTAETSTPYIYWNSVSNTGFGLDCSQNPGDVAGYYISATGPIA